MRRLLKSRSKKAGLPPGTVVYTGERKEGPVTINLMEYGPGDLREQHDVALDTVLRRTGTPSVTWIDVNGVHDTDLIQRCGAHLNLHPLTREDIATVDQRPKVEESEQHLFVVAKMLDYNQEQRELQVEQVSLVVQDGLLVSFQERKGDVFGQVRTRLRHGKGRIRDAGADYLLYALLDAMVDHYFLVLERLEEAIESVEDQLVAAPDPQTPMAIQTLKRDLAFVRKAVWPLREVIGRLERTESSLIAGGTRVYLRDLYDHTIQVIDTVETFRDMIAGMLDIHLSTVSNRMNEVMKVLTIIATLFIPLGFIAGLYGMNFTHMPELAWRWGYPLVLAGMGVVAAGMLLYFARKKWL